MSLYSKKLEKDFINEFLEKNPNISREELIEIFKDFKVVLDNSKDKTLKEILSILVEDINLKVKDLMEKYPIPGYNIEVDSGMFGVKLYGGVMDETNKPMKKDAIFDVASITKLFTQIISYNLINEGYYSFNDKVVDLAPAFKNAHDLNIKTIMEFGFTYSLDDRIENATSKEEALDILHTLGLREKKYAYIDFGMICLKEVMEHVTGKTYEELVNEYIINKLDIKNTYLNVPKEKLDLITGTPNAYLGKGNDLKAIKLGGVSGHSGVMADTKGLITVVKNLYLNKNFFPGNLSDVYIESKISKIDNWKRGKMGNACVVGGPFVDEISSLDASAFQGSTRTQVNVGTYNNILTSSAMLLNPASMGLERAKELEERINKKIVSKYSFEGQEYSQIASQILLPTDTVVKPLTNEMAKLSLKLSFLNKLVNSYEPNYNDKINIEIEYKKR